MRGNIGQQWRTPLRFAWFLVMIHGRVVILSCYSSGYSSENKILLMPIGLNMLSRGMHCVYKTKLVNNGSGHSLFHHNIYVIPVTTLHAFMTALTSWPKLYCDQRRVDKISFNLISEARLAAARSIVNWAQCRWRSEGMEKLCFHASGRKKNSFSI